MAREDKILQTFLSDPIIKEKYGVETEEYLTIEQALESNEPIVCAIAMIIEGLDKDSGMNDRTLYQRVTNHLNL